MSFLRPKYAKQKLESLLKELHIEVVLLDKNIKEKDYEYVRDGSKRVISVCLEMIEAAYATSLGEK